MGQHGPIDLFLQLDGVPYLCVRVRVCIYVCVIVLQSEVQNRHFLAR